MNKPENPNIIIPESFAENGVKTDFDSNKLLNGFDRIQPDVLTGDNLNKFIDDTYKGLNYGIKGVDYLEERWKSQITNCLLEVPQRIKYDLTDGTLTIKAGSIVIVPYGTEDLSSTYPVGATFINDNFTVYDTQYTEDADGNCMFFVWAEFMDDVSAKDNTDHTTNLAVTIRLNDNIIYLAKGGNQSGTSTTATNNYSVYYNTSTNKVNNSDSTSTIETNYIHSFPILLSKGDGTNAYASIYQVFNGMGYIGTTLWIDKGIKGLITSGPNKDNTSNNIEWVNDEFLITWWLAGSRNFYLTYTKEFGIGYPKTDLTFFAQSLPTTLSSTQASYCYVEPEKQWYYSSGSITPNWEKVNHIILSGSCNVTDDVITLFTPKQPFRAVDYSDKSTVSGWGMPSGKYEILPAGASGATYIAPANGYFTARVTGSGCFIDAMFNDYKAIGTNSTASSNRYSASFILPVLKGQKVVIEYNGTIQWDGIQFVYAQGEV